MYQLKLKPVDKSDQVTLKLFYYFNIKTKPVQTTQTGIKCDDVQVYYSVVFCAYTSTYLEVEMAVQ